MGNMAPSPSIDLEIELQKPHRLLLEDGDLGAQYRLQISLSLKDAAQFRQRALLPEQKLKMIQDLLDEKSVDAEEKLGRLRGILRWEDDLSQARSEQSTNDGDAK